MKTLSIPTILAVIAALVVCAAMCDAGDLRVYHCREVATPPTIDGKLDDEAWKVAPAVEFVLSTTGEPVTKKTIAKMCWDNTHLYIGFENQDEDIWGTLTKRDDPIYTEEVVEAFIAPSCNLDRYFEFNVSPRNTLFDALIGHAVKGVPGAGTDHGWNCPGIRTAVFVDGTLDNRTDKDRMWSAEFAIPFSGIDRPTPRIGERWRINLYRIDLTPPPAEFQAWSPTMQVPAAFHVPERFGTLYFEDNKK